MYSSSLHQSSTSYFSIFYFFFYFYIYLIMSYFNIM